MTVKGIIRQNVEVEIGFEEAFKALCTELHIPSPLDRNHIYLSANDKRNPIHKSGIFVSEHSDYYNNIVEYKLLTDNENCIRWYRLLREMLIDFNKAPRFLAINMTE